MDKIEKLKLRYNQHVVASEWNEALAVLEQMIAVTSDASFHSRRGMILFLLKHYEQSVAELERALAINPDYHIAQQLLTQVALKLKTPELVDESSVIAASEITFVMGKTLKTHDP